MSIPAVSAPATAVTALLIRRVLRLLVVCAGVSLVTFSILHVSGDPVALMLPGGARGRPGGASIVDGLRSAAGHAVRAASSATPSRATSGTLSITAQPALPLVLERMPTTLLLTLLAMLLAIAGGAAGRASTAPSAAIRWSITSRPSSSSSGQSMPVFWTGIMLMLLFAVEWRVPSRLGLGDVVGRWSCPPSPSGPSRRRSCCASCAPACWRWSTSTTCGRRAPRACRSGG